LFRDRQEPEITKAYKQELYLIQEEIEELKQEEKKLDNVLQQRLAIMRWDGISRL